RASAWLMSDRSAGLGPAHTRAGPARAGRSNPPALPWSPGGIACPPPRWQRQRLHLVARPRTPGPWRPTLRRDVPGLPGSHSTCQNLTTLRIGEICSCDAARDEYYVGYYVSKGNDIPCIPELATMCD